MLSGYGLFLRKWASRRIPTSYESEFVFIVSMTVLFHELFYLILPIAFFFTASGFAQNVKLYFLDSQCKIFLIIQLIVALTDNCYCLWSCRKHKLLADSRQSARYRQKELNAMVEVPEFPMDSKVVLLFKVWSFSLFYSFYSPFVTIMLLVLLLVMFCKDKHAIYTKYRATKKMSNSVYRNLLNKYLLYFSAFILFVYCYGVASKGVEIVVACVFTVAVLLVSIAFSCWSKNRRRSAIKAQLASHPFKELCEMAKDSRIFADSHSYYEVYSQYLQSLEQPQLDERINAFLATLQPRE